MISFIERGSEICVKHYLSGKWTNSLFQYFATDVNTARVFILLGGELPAVFDPQKRTNADARPARAHAHARFLRVQQAVPAGFPPQSTSQSLPEDD